MSESDKTVAFVATVVGGLLLTFLGAFVLQWLARRFARCPRCGARLTFTDETRGRFYVCTTRCEGCGYGHKFCGG